MEERVGGEEEVVETAALLTREELVKIPKKDRSRLSEVSRILKDSRNKDDLSMSYSQWGELLGMTKPGARAVLLRFSELGYVTIEKSGDSGTGGGVTVRLTQNGESIVESINRFNARL